MVRRLIMMGGVTLGILFPGSLKADWLNLRDTGFTTLELSTRAQGMGGAYVALSNDWGASQFNPAGLVQLKNRELGTMYTDLYGLGLLTLSFISLVEPTATGAGGLSWAHLSADLEPETWNYDMVSLSYTRKFPRREIPMGEVFSSWGISAKYIAHTTSWEDGSGYSLDIGFLSRGSKVSWGVAVQDLVSQIKWDTGRKEKITPTLKAGVCGYVLPSLLLLGDTELTPEDIPLSVSVGGEWWITKNIALRGGLRRIFQEEGELVLSAGLGFRFPLRVEVQGISGIGFDYAFTYTKLLKNTHRFSLSLSF